MFLAKANFKTGEISKKHEKITKIVIYHKNTKKVRKGIKNLNPKEKYHSNITRQKPKNKNIPRNLGSAKE